MMRFGKNMSFIIQIEVKKKRITCFLDHFGRVLALGVSWETIKLVFAKLSFNYNFNFNLVES